MMINLANPKPLILSAAAALGLAFAAPAASAGDFVDISVDSLDFGDEDFLQKLVEMDADDIAEMREEMAEARAELRNAIDEIKKARAEAEATPEAKSVFLTAMEAASGAVTSTTGAAFKKIRAELDRAEGELNASNDISAAEIEETGDIIAALREELTGIEDAVSELVDAMKA